jgi:hypothetical protein
MCEPCVRTANHLGSTVLTTCLVNAVTWVRVPEPDDRHTPETTRTALIGRSGAQRERYSLSSPRLMIVFWISLVPSPISRNGASRISRSISYSLE